MKFNLIGLDEVDKLGWLKGHILLSVLSICILYSLDIYLNRFWYMPELYCTWNNGIASSKSMK